MEHTDQTGTQPGAETTSTGRRVTRRQALQRGALVAGLGLAGTALSGAAAADDQEGQDGMGFMWVEDFAKALDDDQTFQFVEADGWTLEHAAGCSGNANAPTREYKGYLIRFEQGIYDGYPLGTLGHLFVEANRHIELGVWQNVATARPCPPSGTVTAPWGLELEQDHLRIAFEPADG